jgi:hypothetical protein
MHQLAAISPQLAVRQEQRAQVVREQLGRHGELLTARVQGAALANEVVGNLLRRHHDVVSADDIEFEDRPILVGPGFELVVGRDVKGAPDNWLLCSR